jgi:hypothetical protein
VLRQGRLPEDPIIYREENLKIIDEEVQLEDIEKEYTSCNFYITNTVIVPP